MIVTAIKTRPLLPPQDDLLSVLDESLPQIAERSIIAISSKVVAIGQGRCEAVPQGIDPRSFKDTLAKREASAYLERDDAFPHPRLFTLYEGVLDSGVGIDESNGNGWFILLPEKLDETAEMLRAYIKKIRGVAEIGIVIVDSRTLPMRNGTTGIALGHAGFEALYDYRGEKDIFGRTIRFERLNVADTLAASATLALGEGGECSPIALIEDVPHVVFSEETVEDPMLVKTVPMEEDVFARFLINHPWKRKDQ